MVRVVALSVLALAIHAGIADRIPERHLKYFSWSWVLLPYHFYLSSIGRM